MFVFVSHSGVDKEKARGLDVWLTEKGVPHFFDETSIAWGGLISQEVKSAIERATHFVILVSPPAVKSGWVNYELGIAEGLYIARPGQIRILPWMVYPVDPVPSFLADRKYKTTLQQVIAELAAYAEESLTNGSQSYIDSYGYTYSGFTARAFRLVGAADEFFPQDCITIEVSQQPYVLPRDILRTKSDVLRQLESAAEQRKALFFDGPHTRLLDYSVAGTDASTEQKRLTLRLGPIGWHDYSVTHWHTDQMSQTQLAEYIDLEAIARTGSIVHTRLHNILDTATTLITSDGYLLFSQRGPRVSVDETLLTSCVAENIHAEKDRSLSETANLECPAPFRATLRGIDEEMSPLVAHALAANGSPLYCLGLSFDLDAYHPDILFFAVLSLTYDQVLSACKERPGQDFFEGHVKGVSVTSKDGL